MRKKLSILLLISLLLNLSACGGEIKETTGQTETESETLAETEKVYSVALPDYEGYTFTFLNQEDILWSWTNHILDYEEITGNNLSDAVYNRNRTVEEGCNIRFEVIKGSLGQTNDMRKMMNQAIAADEDIYDVIYTSLFFGGATSFDGLSTINLYDVESLQLDKEWWNQSFIQSATIGTDKLYTTIDYINLMGYSSCNILFFSKDHCGNNNLEYPYDLVSSGNWTYDEMFAMISVVNNIGTQVNWDPNPDGNAVYGFVGSHQEAIISLLSGCGTRLINKNEEGIPTINTNILPMVDAYDAILNSFSMDGYCMLINEPSPPSGKGQGPEYFMRGNALFTHDKLGSSCSSVYRECDVNYGILPMPKADAAQDTYHSLISEKAFGLNIPVTASDAERTGTVMDYLAYVSYYDVIPVLQENLCYKGVSSAVDIEMMDIILETQFVDIGIIYGWTTNFLNDVCGNKVIQGNNTFSSSWVSHEKKVQSSIDKLFND